MENYLTTCDDLVRLVLAQQWAVAATMYAAHYEQGVREWQHRADAGLGPSASATTDEIRRYVEANAEVYAMVYMDPKSLGRLPSPADIVDEWLT